MRLKNSLKLIGKIEKQVVEIKELNKGTKQLLEEERNIVKNEGKILIEKVFEFQNTKLPIRQN